ncbi:PQQ-dependent dehydrogenase, methanol/ethanol family [Pontibacillus marinus]|uniref:Quinoprotein ethanol dehydrogenase n=1 Tax=Pontibacillus marinus BH030004 = DSM 16465 TaxID=1385511 RepID=A0A0A5GI65_9BACI|nr:PQQ-dependent dehydrogenase, methanol/ethanol family [Pontibacillus marinus]KGX91704.1 quinoprotein ethanol dehydrogenase [Pontibacillus marinus BH030004 = DSM 16465]
MSTSQKVYWGIVLVVVVFLFGLIIYEYANFTSQSSSVSSTEKGSKTETTPEKQEGTESETKDDDKISDEETTQDQPESTSTQNESVEKNDQPTITQHRTYNGKTAPAFTPEDLTALPTSNWLTNGGDTYNRRYSPLNEINADNVQKLKGEWVAALGSGTEFKYSGEATPIVYDGVMYVITGANDVLALDAKSGETIWEFRANLSEKLDTVCCGWTSRGVAIGDGKVYVGLLDARLVALDQKTGEIVWETTVADWEKGYTITNAPLYYDGKVYTGLSGGEYGIRGRVTAFDADMGREIWRFYTIPGPGEEGYDTWPHDNDAWLKGGAPVWQTPAVDPELGTLYFSTGNAAPDLDGSQREGNNLFTSSIVAIDVNTGKYKWHFQEVHHDIWDLDAPNPVILFDVEKDGETRKALAQAGKTGWVYILDRVTGEPLIGIEEKAVPQDPRQKTAATQPIPKGDSFVPQDISEEDVKRDLGEFEGEYGDIFTPFWEEPVALKPSAFGGANWPPSAYNPNTEYFYVLGTDSYMTYTRSEEEFEEGSDYMGSIMAPVNDAPEHGTVTAIDVKTNKIAWQKVWDDKAYSGVLTTKGNLVFVGHNDGRFIAYHAETGETLWEFKADAGANAPAITYELDGKQYIAILVAGNSLAGSKHGDSLWTFSLDGTIESGETPERISAEATSTSKETQGKETPDQVASGEEIYKTNCLSCHGTEGANGHNGPNLQNSAITENMEKIIERINNGGSKMPAFKGTLTEQEIQDVARYLNEVVAPKGE